jgi:hypothetical protein
LIEPWYPSHVVRLIEPWYPPHVVRLIEPWYPPHVVRLTEPWYPPHVVRLIESWYPPHVVRLTDTYLWSKVYKICPEVSSHFKSCHHDLAKQLLNMTINNNSHIKYYRLLCINSFLLKNLHLETLFVRCHTITDFWLYRDHFFWLKVSYMYSKIFQSKLSICQK